MNILVNLDGSFKVELGEEYKASDLNFLELEKNIDFKLPQDYIELTSDGIDKVFYLTNGVCMQLYGIGSVDFLYEDYDFKEYLPNCFPIGDNMSGYFYLYYRGESGVGIYSVPYSPLEEDYVEFVSQSLTDLLVRGQGVNNLIL